MNRKRLTNLSKSGALFSARMAGAGLMFLVQAAIARWWGSDVLADYLLLISAANIAAMGHAARLPDHRLILCS
jgi:hypothetical protein